MFRSLVLLLLLLPVNFFAEEKAEELAQKAASDWLVLIDSGKYAESWQAAAEIFKNAVKQDQWEARAKSVRDRTGAFKQRTLLNARYSESLPGAPTGRYFVIQYTALYEAGQFTETAVPTQEKDGSWKVSGYFLKPAQ